MTRERAVREALVRLIRFVDGEVRSWLPNEHTNCGIDSGCAHGAMEREMFEALDREIEEAANVAAPGGSGRPWFAATPEPEAGGHQHCACSVLPSEDADVRERVDIIAALTRWVLADLSTTAQRVAVKGEMHAMLAALRAVQGGE